MLVLSLLAFNIFRLCPQPASSLRWQTLAGFPRLPAHMLPRVVFGADGGNIFSTLPRCRAGSNC